LLTGQGVVTRLLFAPWTGLCLSAGAVIAWLEAGNARVVKAVVSGVLVATWLLALTLDGYGELFRLRDARNDAQVAAWLTLLDAPPALPTTVYAVSLYGSDRLFSEPSPVDESLAGITETPWALHRVILQESGRSVYAVGGHPFVPVCIERTADPEQLRITSMFNDVRAPVSSVLAVEVRDDVLAVVDSLTFGATTIELPLAASVGAAASERLSLTAAGPRICHAYGHTVP
jgi:hypothetical protein